MRTNKTIHAMIIASALFLVSCGGENTGSCHIVCTSSSTGAVFSDEIFVNYTKAECDDQFNGTTTSLVPCTLEFTED